MRIQVIFHPMILCGLLSVGLTHCMASRILSTDNEAEGLHEKGSGDFEGPTSPDGTSLPPVADGVSAFEALSLPTAANKVKTILTQTPCTQEEMSALESDESALGTLVDNWLATDSYKNTMLHFFMNAFQQSQLPLSGKKPLVQNMREMFARTVLQLISEGKPFTDAITTQRYMMTTGLMYSYTLQDTEYDTDENRRGNRWFDKDPNWHFTVQKAKGPVSLSDASNPKGPNYMTFYSPILGDAAKLDRFGDGAKCTGIDPMVFRNEQIFARITNGVSWVDNLLKGEELRFFYPKEYQQDTVLCAGLYSGPSYFQASDYNDWRMVTIQPVTANANQDYFINLPAFREGQSTLTLYTTHVGYLTTPSFLTQWATNKSNSFRATVNQALIVGLNGVVGDNKLVPLAIQPSVDAAHSANPACMNCHQDLDPLRQFYRQSFTYFNSPQQDEKQRNIPAMFAFDGVVQSGKGVVDLAQIIASHPHFAAAWVQKVCTWANGAPCVDNDPELLRIAKNFTANNFQWDAMVRDVMLSPLITYRAPTVTTQLHGQASIVARRDQICGLFEHTLGMGDICARLIEQTGTQYTVPSLASILPGDQYGRGVVAPLYVTRADVTYRTAIENLCAVTAQQVNTTKPNIPLALTDPNIAIPALVHDFMGLGPERDSQPISILREHYDALLTNGQNKDTAWQSTFTLACISPFVAGNGQ